MSPAVAGQAGKMPRSPRTKPQTSDMEKRACLIHSGSRRTPRLQSAANIALCGAALLPEANSKENYGKPQEPGTQGGPEGAGAGRAKRGGETERKAASDGSDGTENRRQRGRDARTRFQRLPP